MLDHIVNRYRQMIDEQVTPEHRAQVLAAMLREARISGQDAEAVRRFSLFHEAFHVLAHRRATPVFRNREATAGSFNELLADYFASCILMPKKWVREKWAEVKDLDRMAEIFVVPKSTSCIRLKRLGLIQ